MRCLALARVDKFAALERVIGATASEEVLIEVGRLLKETLHPKELVGRFGGVRFLALLERGNEHDINAWSERLLARVHKHVMRIRDKSVSVTCTIGLSVVSPGRGRSRRGDRRMRSSASAAAPHAAATRASPPTAPTTTAA